jgi:hypothetical protein
MISIILYYLFNLLTISEIYGDSHYNKSISGKATIYHLGDGHCGRYKADGKKFTSEDDHIAHRWLSLRLKGRLCNIRTKLCIIASIGDRGPFGALRECGKGKPVDYKVAGKIFRAKKITWNKKCYYWQAQPYKLQKGFKYRGEFDLTKPIARKIDHRPFDKVIFYYR